jgi:hypothetical protein
MTLQRALIITSELRVLLLAGCGNAAPDEPAGSAQTQQALADTVPDAPGYQHTLAASLFKPGNGLRAKYECVFRAHPIAVPTAFDH